MGEMRNKYKILMKSRKKDTFRGFYSDGRMILSLPE
jgi:hypothetical protein